MKKKILAVLAIGMAFASLNAPAAFAVSWTDWSSVTPGAAGSGTGVINTGSETVGVTMSGMIGDFINGTTYYAAYPATYGGLNPSDLIREWNSGSVTLQFDKAVVDPYIAFVSVGQGYAVNYKFQGIEDEDISVESFGTNNWGYIGYSLTDDGNGNSIFSGYEFNGILKLEGTYNSLTFDIRPNEYWHGFNIGIDSVANAVPEPATMLLFGAGILGLSAVARRKNNA